jgi:hypothetical protein
MAHNCIVGVVGGHSVIAAAVSAVNSLSWLVVTSLQLAARIAVLNLHTHFLCHKHRLAMLEVQAIAHLLQPHSNLVKVLRLLPAFTKWHWGRCFGSQSGISVDVLVIATFFFAVPLVMAARGSQQP